MTKKVIRNFDMKNLKIAVMTKKEGGFRECFIGLGGWTPMLAYMHELIHKIKSPPIIPSTTDNGKMIFILSLIPDISIHSFIHSGHFYSAPSSPLPLRGAPVYSTDTVSEFHAEAHRQLQVKDLPKVPT